MSERSVFNQFNYTIKTDNYLYYDNGSSICLVAHADTLTHNNIVIHEKNGILTNKHGILGADDRAGCYAIYRLINENCNYLITLGEECGGIGAKYAARELPFTGVKLFIELDRRGCNEYVFYSYDLHPSVKKYIKSFGYIENYGSYSDIAEFDCAPGVNISIGYYNQHTQRESLHLDEMELTINRVKMMLANPIKKLFTSQPKRWIKSKYDLKLDMYCEICGYMKTDCICDYFKDDFFNEVNL